MEEIQMSEKNLLEIKDLHVNVEDKEILHGVNLEVGKDKVHVLMGPNGTGKSTLGYAITGHPKYASHPDRSFLMERTSLGCR